MKYCGSSNFFFLFTDFRLWLIAYIVIYLNKIWNSIVKTTLKMVSKSEIDEMNMPVWYMKCIFKKSYRHSFHLETNFCNFLCINTIFTNNTDYVTICDAFSWIVYEVNKMWKTSFKKNYFYEGTDLKKRIKNTLDTWVTQYAPWNSAVLFFIFFHVLKYLLLKVIFHVTISVWCGFTIL